MADPLYEMLPGEPKDADNAASFYRSAAESGDAVAALRLAEIMLAGPADGASEARAAHLLRTAAAGAETEGYAAARLRELEDRQAS